jgi:hypothetical protein
MTDDINEKAAELAAQMANDEALYGFSVIDGNTGERIDPRSIRPMERYALYGVIAEEHEENTQTKTLEEQRVDQQHGGTLIYETDDYDEARAIFDAGGYLRDGVWTVVTRVEDRVKNPPSQAPSKESYQ